MLVFFCIALGLAVGFRLCMLTYGIPMIERRWGHYTERRRDIRALCSWHR